MTPHTNDMNGTCAGRVRLRVAVLGEILRHAPNTSEKTASWMFGKMLDWLAELIFLLSPGIRWRSFVLWLVGNHMHQVGCGGV
jgi:hypothetical protein